MIYRLKMIANKRYFCYDCLAYMADNTDLLKQIREVIREENEPIKKDLQDVKQALARTNSTLEAVEAGQREIREIMTTKADILDLGVKITSHRRRIEDLEKSTDIPNPEKN